MPAKAKHLVNRDLFSNYYLENLLTESDTWKDIDEGVLKNKYEEIKELYESKKDNFERYNESQLEDNFIRPIFNILGLFFEVQEKVSRSTRFPDYGIFKEQKDSDHAIQHKGEKDFYNNAVTIAEAKRWRQNLDKMDKSGNVRDFSNPSHQVHVYQQETEVDWAILTNGKKWRLYYSKTSHKLDSYYEIDLPAILDMDEGYEVFKYFYLFFRVEAFLKNVRGTCFLDRIFEKSNLFSQELEDDLKENIYEAIKQLAQGFLNHSENKLDPGSDMRLIHDSSLVYLYRLIFVLYAESEGRDLLDTNNRIYNDDYSLNSLKQQVCEVFEKDPSEFKGWQTKIWNRLEELFVLIDKGSENKGIPEDQLYIPAYNGGLFRTDVDDEASEELVFLKKKKVPDKHMAKVIDLLTRHESKNGKGRVFVDYSSLNIRHLGSIYEGLLEYRLNVATEKMVAVKEKKEQKWYAKSEFDGDSNIIEELDEGEVYLTTDKGERKATGSYYTPEYIVQYIVENTLDPILDRIKDDLLRESGGNFANEFAERVFQLKVLDPAMGSGHFLTNAVDHLAREIINARDKQAEEHGIDTIDGSHDIHWARRQVAQRCIYGVDLNPMAVELAKVSLWLRTLAARQPLAFLDHHLKTGNSLIGSDIEDIEELDSGGKKAAENVATLEDFGMTWKGTMEDLMAIYQDFIKIENQELADIKEMEEKFHEFEHEPIKERLEAMANVHTAREFGIDVHDGAFARMAKAIDDEGKWAKIAEVDWFVEAQELAESKNFFHWKLAFPEVFYDEQGGRREGAGFDVVIGNPPYVKVQTLENMIKEYLKINYSTTKGKFDLYIPFLEKAYKLTKEGLYFSYILPSKFTETQSGEDLRRLFIEKATIEKYLDFSEYQVFDNVTTYTCILIGKNKIPSKRSKIKYKLITDKSGVSNYDFREIVCSNLSLDPWNLSKYGSPLYEIAKKLKASNMTQELENIFEHISKGIDPGGATDIFVLDKEEAQKFEARFIRKIIPGDSISKYSIQSDKYIIFPYEKKSQTYKVFSEEVLEGTKTFEYLKKYESELKKRDYVLEAGKKWFELWNERQPNNQEREKLVICNMSKVNRFGYDGESRHTLHTTYSLIPYEKEEKNLLFLNAILNSKLLTSIFSIQSTKVKGGYYRYNRMYLKDLPIIQIPDKEKPLLQKYVTNLMELKEVLKKINTEIRDYLGRYSNGKTIEDLYTPIQGVIDNILTKTQSDKDNLRIGGIDFEEDDDELILKVSARYKPENEEEFTNLDRWGYTETDLIPAMKFTGSKKELALIREFTKLAVEKGGGFANFRETATKTQSILDRLEKLTLPKLSDVEKGLEKYLVQKAEAERLEAEIREIDHTIDAIVFDLYGLTEEEVETVLDSLCTEEGDKRDIMGKFKSIKQVVK